MFYEREECDLATCVALQGFLVAVPQGGAAGPPVGWLVRVQFVNRLAPGELCEVCSALKG
jgi:hypothetical protein